MSVHEYDNDMRPDEEFVKGDISFLVEGNHCRLLVGRRTTGYIEKIFESSAIFRWRITKYEDKGKHWDLPFEQINRFQFEKDANKLDRNDKANINDLIEKYDQELTIEKNMSEAERTKRRLNNRKKVIKKWLNKNSLFFKKKQKLNFSDNKGSEYLFQDLNNYMKKVGLSELEEKTSEIIVLNPNSGEWIKGMKIVLAELGLTSFDGKVPRTNDIFMGSGEKKYRRKYLINRLAFIRAYFELLNISEVVLYRGMSTEGEWMKKSRTFLACTFSREVAESFSSFDKNSKYKNSYMIKFTFPVNKLFMTYLETESMNNQYEEAEALILYNEKLCI